MNALVLNGSPRSKNGMTWWLLERFIQGMTEVGAQVEIVQLASKKIDPCIGCFSCWFKTPGTCVHRDDMETVLAAMGTCDGLVLATPVYFDGMSGLLKNCVDRLLPLIDPQFEMRDGRMHHPLSCPMPTCAALVSACGFAEMDTFDPLTNHVRALCRNIDAKYAGAVLRPAAPMLPFTTLRHPLKTRSVSKAVRKAGAEFATDGMISDDTAQKISEEIVPTEAYMKGANRHFERLAAKKK
jgi:hypothetical protein